MPADFEEAALDEKRPRSAGTSCARTRSQALGSYRFRSPSYGSRFNTPSKPEMIAITSA
jgi:hypothetical protein